MEKVLYHGSQTDKLAFEHRPMYLSNSIELAIDFAKGYAFGYDLQEDDVPTLYAINININNPKFIYSTEEYEKYMDITTIDWSVPQMRSEGYDGCIYIDEDCVYYMVFDSIDQCSIINKTILKEER